VGWLHSNENPVPHLSDVTILRDGAPALVNIEHGIRQPRAFETFQPEPCEILMAAKLGKPRLQDIHIALMHQL